MHLCIGFLEKVEPNFIDTATGELRLSSGFTGNEVIDSNTLPFPILAEPQSIHSQRIDNGVVEEESFYESRVDDGEYRYH